MRRNWMAHECVQTKLERDIGDCAILSFVIPYPGEKAQLAQPSATVTPQPSQGRHRIRAIMVMFDSLNRRMLPPYGCDWTHAPNFARLAQRTVTFDNCYVGSMPCMPARRELHTGRYNFLHRSWGPMEPFDDSMPEILRRQRRLYPSQHRPLPLF